MIDDSSLFVYDFDRSSKWGGARVAEWARLLSECWVKPVAGSNPALPATKGNAFRKERIFDSIVCVV